MAGGADSLCLFHQEKLLLQVAVGPAKTWFGYARLAASIQASRRLNQSYHWAMRKNAHLPGLSGYTCGGEKVNISSTRATSFVLNSQS